MLLPVDKSMIPSNVAWEGTRKQTAERSGVLIPTRKLKIGTAINRSITILI